MVLPTSDTKPRIIEATVTSNEPICPAHLRMTLALDDFPDARPGQFIQLHPPAGEVPLLPRAFSIGGLRRESASAMIDVIYRVEGAGTQWMASLRSGANATILGPLGNGFAMPRPSSKAALVIGGVGLPPLLWFAQWLSAAQVPTIAFVGARSADGVLIDLHGKTKPSADATEGILCATEFDAVGAPVVVSTDDGSCGYHGSVIDAFRVYIDAHETFASDLVVYTCGPERMMQALAECCIERNITCHVCMERPMACGIGSCQSCIVPVSSEESADGWRYALCCQDGPVFDARNILWTAPD